MASITKLPSGSWRAQVRRKGHSISETFLHRHVSLVMLVFAMMAVIQHHANAVSTLKNAAANQEESPCLIRWSVQEIRRIAMKLAKRRIQPASVIAWSCWRRARQAHPGTVGRHPS
jgi:hypothetical protein